MAGGGDAMLSFPIRNAALDLKGKPPAELPHGLLPVPPEVRELIAEQAAKYPPGAFAPFETERICFETVGWYFDGLGHPVVYRKTPEGPEVLAVGREEMAAYHKRVPDEIRPADVKVYRGYL
jgi:hypothetical protein